MNILKQRHFLATLQTVFTCMVAFAQDQSYTSSKYGVPVVDKPEIYRKNLAIDSNRRMVELKSIIPNIVYDLKYAGKNNFMHRRMYPSNTNYSFLRLPAARSLANVQAELEKNGYGLKVFDAYRPYSVTVDFWELVKDERYVASPTKGSGHNRGLAIDVTIVELESGKELDMGTGFDNFSDTAHSNYQKLPFDVLKNRRMLRELMEKNGFTVLETEWWHFSWPNNRQYEVLDLPFESLRRLQ